MPDKAHDRLEQATYQAFRAVQRARDAAADVFAWQTEDDLADIAVELFRIWDDEVKRKWPVLRTRPNGYGSVSK